MNRRFARLALVVLAASSFPVARAQSPEELFDRAYDAFEAGRWNEAARAFAAARELGVRDARLEYNLANAHYRDGRIGHAILHWERALRLAPGDPDIKANLELARERLVDRVETPRPGALVEAVRSAQDRLGPELQAWVVLFVSWLSAGIVVWGLRRPRAWSPGCGWALAALVTIGILGGWSLNSTWSRLEGAGGAIVLASAVEVLAGPSEANATVFRIHEGTRVELRESRGSWRQVVLPNGLTGWVPGDAVEAI
jgi:tetratricopeptide (TPR) repeat protein